jgi:hypothetical protein
LPATAIRYTECVSEPVAIVVSTGNSVDYCAMSRALRDMDGIDWIRRGQPLPQNCATRQLSGNPERVRRGERTEGPSAFQDWFGRNLRSEVSEDAIGLGEYGKTLTVLYGIELPEESDEDSDDEVIEAWPPRHRR